MGVRAIDSASSTDNEGAVLSSAALSRCDEERPIAAARDASGSVARMAAPASVAHGKPVELALRRLNDLVDLQSARVSDLLHDEASQVLAAVHMTIEDIAHDVPAPVQARLRRVRQHLHDVAEQLRRISHDLYPRIVDDLGVIDAIKFISRAFTRQTGVQLAIDVRVDECPAAVGAVVYRLVHEALANIGKHARASGASIVIAREGSRLVCTICDDGVGFDVAATLARHTNLGLMLSRGRVEAAGGTLDITSAPQQGTRLRAAIPLEI